MYYEPNGIPTNFTFSQDAHLYLINLALKVNKPLVTTCSKLKPIPNHQTYKRCVDALIFSGFSRCLAINLAPFMKSVLLLNYSMYKNMNKSMKNNNFFKEFESKIKIMDPKIIHERILIDSLVYLASLESFYLKEEQVSFISKMISLLPHEHPFFEICKSNQTNFYWNFSLESKSRKKLLEQVLQNCPKIFCDVE